MVVTRLCLGLEGVAACLVHGGNMLLCPPTWVPTRCVPGWKNHPRHLHAQRSGDICPSACMHVCTGPSPAGGRGAVPSTSSPGGPHQACPGVKHPCPHHGVAPAVQMAPPPRRVAASTLTCGAFCVPPGCALASPHPSPPHHRPRPPRSPHQSQPHTQVNFSAFSSN